MLVDGPGTSGAATWQDQRWRDAALSWATTHLERVGRPLAGGPEQPHVRAWSTVFRLPVRGGLAWLKSVGPGSAQEPPLAEALGRWVPDRVVVPLAVDRERRLVLLPDGGPTLRAAGTGGPAAWEVMVRDHARLQIAVAPHADAMVALGVPDHRPERLPALVAELLADDEAQLVGQPGGLTAEVRGQLRARLGNYADACGHLAGGPVPGSLQHDDLHDANVFVAAGRHRFFDWGDASVGHPFLVLLVALRMVAHGLGVPHGDPVLVRLRDAYLDEWRSFGTPGELRELCVLALRVGPLQRALTWRRILHGVHADERAEWADAVPGWTAEQLAPGPLSAEPDRHPGD
ncbi:phosphotransferase [Blastococcus saxobsidens]|uniref:Phosphotransferase family enzyme n=1 Tax=Blastococcus saxobsidens TaxID=138336 RepID=A0A4Q7Y413_9ACTN|nr:phosphotransferase [Blastococcus saxobsidens]RZU31550.1 phosphotransferase family enzyme [Blastococcus saxobsidens]